ncbi:hypothetical protein C4565_05615 [Candidatus Parcubacteria bacterium]|nr:MAG: hypothetical protein C4565_05615 [Candidatus Parcubacteria bacterium]
MPDAATHILVPLSLIRLTEITVNKELISAPVRYIFALGCIFPDLIDKSIPYSFKYLIQLGEKFYLIEENKYSPLEWEFLHTPFILLIVVYLFCFIFDAKLREKVFLSIAAGVGIHLIFDLLQGKICDVGYLWFFPFSFYKPTIVTLFYDDQTIILVPLFFIIFGISEIIFKYQQMSE